ncbi:PKD domain-containing protein [Photobacterium minamisatsumaniensis]|uniref:RHS repeat domain-containing protein n=1 Tax=Photobacterium minamisatsumaniensis TaxID=2910233 RepID=UPI003D0CA974
MLSTPSTVRNHELSSQKTTSIDPATRALKCTIPLGVINHGYGQAHPYALVIEYNMLAPKWSNYGQGWSIPHTWIDRGDKSKQKVGDTYEENHPILHLQDGRSFTIYYRNSEGWYKISDKHTDDIRVYYWNRNKYTIYYKDGRREDIIFFDDQKNSGLDDSAYTVKTFSVSGQFYTEAKYGPCYSGGQLYRGSKKPFRHGHPTLRYIKDSNGEERVSVSYTHNKVTLTIKDSYHNSRTIVLYLADGLDAFNYLTSITVDTDTLFNFENQLVGGHDLKYYPSGVNWYYAITKITHGVTGLIEEVFWSKDLWARHPEGKEQQYELKYRVSKFEQKSASGEILTNTEYNDKVEIHGITIPSYFNYTGYGDFSSEGSQKDPIYHAPSGYSYFTNELHLDNDGTNLAKTSYRYNKFHLLIEQKKYTNGSLIQLQAYHYPAMLNKWMYEQPDNYDKPTQIDTTYYQNGNDRTESEHLKYDKYGNVIEHVHSDGSMEVFTYTLTTDGPEGTDMKSHIKSYRHYAAGSNLTSETQYTYQWITASTNKNIKTKIKTLESTTSYISNDGSGNKTITKSYHNFTYSGDDLTFGRNSKIIETVNGFNTSYDYTYSENNGEVTTTVTERSYDTLTRTTAVTDNWYLGKTIEEKDYHGNITTYDYYLTGANWGKPKNLETLANNPLYTAKRTFSNNGSSFTDINPCGIATHHKKDGLGRLLQTTKIDQYGEERILNSYEYNKLGQLIIEREYDFFSDGSSIQGITRYEYDALGNVSKITYPDEQVDIISINPVTLTTETNTLDASGVPQPLNLQFFNVNGSIDKEEMHSQGEIFTTKYHYDTHGNLVSSVLMIPGEEFKTTSYQNDAFGRVTNITEPSGIISKYEYAEFTTQDLVTKLTNIANVTIVVGERVYDGLSRIISESTKESAAGTTQYNYESGADVEPFLITTPRGAIYRDINNNLGEITKIQAGKINNTYTYNNSTGRMSKSTSNNNMVDYIYNRIGHLIQESRTIDGITYNSYFTYSFSGLLESYTGYFGETEFYEYDHLGRISKVTFNNKEGIMCSYINMTYNSRGLPIIGEIRTENPTTDKGNTHYLHLNYDNLGREIEREWQGSNGIVYIKLINNFDNFSRLKNRERYYENDLILSEDYIYNDENQLIQYIAKGPLLPQDAYGNEITEELYTYYSVDRQKSKKSHFRNGTSNNQVRTYGSSILQDRLRLKKVENTHSSYSSSASIQYSNAGDIVVDEEGREYIYDEIGQLYQVKTSSGHIISTYTYNAEEQLVKQEMASGETIIYLHRGDQLIYEVCGDTYTKYNRTANIEVSRVISTLNGSNVLTQMTLTDQQGSILERNNVGYVESALSLAYTPFGTSSLTQDKNSTVPNISSASVYPESLDSTGAMIELSVSAFSPNGNKLTYNWTQANGPSTVTIYNSNSTTAYANITSTPATDSTYTFIVTVSDGVYSSSKSVQVYQAGNSAPLITSAKTIPTRTFGGNTVTLQAMAEDPEGKILSYKWEQIAGSTSVAIQNSDKATATIDKFPNLVGAPATYKYKFKVIVSDGKATSSRIVSIGNS